MDKIEITAFGSWVHSTGILGTFNEPLYLIAEIKNNTRQPIKIKEIYISIKNLIFSKKALKQNKIFIIQPSKSIRIQMDIRYLLNNFKSNKKFTIRITSIHNETFESKELSIAFFDELNKKLH